MQQSPSDFTESERRGVYRAIRDRRDVRAQFIPEPLDAAVLARVLHAAHAAPSVGFMQPWDFVVIDDRTIREAVKREFERENARAGRNYQGRDAALYSSLKLEGILESTVNICVTCDRTRGGPHVLGRNSAIETDLFSVCLAIQNLWLAARAEGIGVGWVSILDPNHLSTLLSLPTHVVPVAYLCLGHVSGFPVSPELEAKGWRRRIPLRDLVHRNSWETPFTDGAFFSALAEPHMSQG